MHIDSVKVGTRFRKDMGGVEISSKHREVGLLHPIVVDAGGNLIAGERRLTACQRLGWKDIPATVVDLDEPHGCALNMMRTLSGRRSRRPKQSRSRRQ